MYMNFLAVVIPPQAIYQTRTHIYMCVCTKTNYHKMTRSLYNDSVKCNIMNESKIQMKRQIYAQCAAIPV